MPSPFEDEEASARLFEGSQICVFAGQSDGGVKTEHSPRCSVRQFWCVGNCSCSQLMMRHASRDVFLNVHYSKYIVAFDARLDGHYAPTCKLSEQLDFGLGWV